MDSAIDREARTRIDRVENNQRDLERAMALLQREQAVTAEVLKRVVEAQDRFLTRMDADEKATHVLQTNSAVTRSRLAMIGFAVVFFVGLAGQVVGEWLSKLFGPQ